MPLRKLKEYLDSHNVKYSLIPHALAYTAQTTAQVAHVSGTELAKTVMIKVDGRMAMAVLPASLRVDFDQLTAAVGAEDVLLAVEGDFKDIFVGCEIGAMPPFGNLYGLEVFVEKSLAEDDEIAFNAGSHTELMRMSYADFAELVRPTVVRFTHQPA
jgi:Ala-tRNA(Pro) deacylase